MEKEEELGGKGARHVGAAALEGDKGAQHVGAAARGRDEGARHVGAAAHGKWELRKKMKGKLKREGKGARPWGAAAH